MTSTEGFLAGMNQILMLGGILPNHQQPRRSVQPSPVEHWPPLHAEVLEREHRPIRLQGELAAITARNDTHAAHDQLERGSPVKRFKGTAFREG